MINTKTYTKFMVVHLKQTLEYTYEVSAAHPPQEYHW